MSLEHAVLEGDISAVTKLLNTEKNITQDRITNLKKSIEQKKKDPYTNVFTLLNVPVSAPDSHTDYVKIDNMLDNYSAVITMNNASNRDVDNHIRSFLGGKKTIKRRVKKSKSKKTKSKKAKRTNKRKPRK